MSEMLEKARKYEDEQGKQIKAKDRPAFHVSPYVGWMNDPNGFSYYQGEYHLFYQYNPYDTHWDSMHWGHVVSKDLLHWEYLPAALAPDEDYDKIGCFSGSAIELDDGRQLLMYTAVDHETLEDGSKRDIQTQAVAVGDGRDYVKYKKNPVLTEKDLPEGASKVDFRDPKIWKGKDGNFYCVIGSRPADGSGQILLYRSANGFDWEFVSPHKDLLPEGKIDSTYKSLRWQVFVGIFIGYAGYYIVRKNFSMAMPFLTDPAGPYGFDKGSLSIVLSLNAVAYALSKFLMGSVSDRSNARVFLPLGLALAALSMMFMAVPIELFGASTTSIVIMAVLNFLVGWFNGMGWPPCGRVMTHWFSVKERGTKMSIWNCAHNVGGALVGPMAVYGAMWFGSWFYGVDSSKYFIIGTYIFPAAVALFVALLAYVLIRDTPQSCGLPTIEKWRNDYPKNYSEKQEEVLTTREIFFKYVLNNKMLWFIAIANAFVYMVRYGCLDWAPTYLKEAQGYDIKEAGWAYFAYEFAAIPGTLVCGWLSDVVFKGRRAITTIIFMALVALFIFLYWQFSDNYMIVTLSLIAIGFFIYGPVMLIGVQALDLAPKNAAGTSAGLTGFFGYFFGTAILANVVMGYVAESSFGWDGTFVLLLIACALSIVFVGFTYKEEQYLVQNRK